MKAYPRSLLGASAVYLALFACGEARPQDNGGNVPFSTAGWSTDFSKRSVPLEEILSGGPPKDGIPAIDRPHFVSIREADEWIGEREPVIVFEHGGVVRAYPWQILIWHEIVNDEVGGIPVTVTYCPLCNTAIAFDRRLDGRLLDFGATGKLRYSDLLMYDRQTESWWQQATGTAIIGELTGATLTFLAAPTMSWADFKSEYPDAEVLSRETGHYRPYGQNPYAGYDTGRPVLYRGPRDDRLPMMERVVVVQVGDEAAAYALGKLVEEQAINHEVGETPIVVFHRPGTASAVDARTIESGRDIGSAATYLRTVDGQTLTFVPDGEGFRDEQTESHWTFFGEAVSGPLKGSQLKATVHYIPFWFAWAAFAPDTPVYGRPED
jgi:hypothetical protein